MESQGHDAAASPNSHTIAAFVSLPRTRALGRLWGGAGRVACASVWRGERDETRRGVTRPDGPETRDERGRTIKTYHICRIHFSLLSSGYI